MIKKMRNVGRNQHRFKDNPLELKFAEAWEKQNTGKSPNYNGWLDYMLAEDNNRPCGEVTDRDREVAATIIQWLGSPVGESWVRETLGDTSR